jgi:hypothetical protein
LRFSKDKKLGYGIDQTFLKNIYNIFSNDMCVHDEFFSNIGTGFNATVNFIKTSSDNSIFVGGTSITTLNGASTYGLKSYNRTITLNTSGLTENNYIIGRVVSYNINSGELLFTPIQVNGSGTYDSWKISLTGSPGQSGTSGISSLDNSLLISS